ncbi:MAG: type II toxin-antitoxin system death-on-curing family toxin [Candidatus Peregrinibacteria bacterium]|nr:type II toxin-antitoxin system death-on-curing family toxin [Candidatus Peregrinibacteria bacterium]
MPKQTQILTIAEVCFIAHTFAENFMEWDEPIPPFSTWFPHELESCLSVPFQTFGRQQLYKGLKAKAAILFYLMIKNHPFQNGNKRIAVTSLMVFLSKNEKWLSVDQQEFYNFAVWVASSPPGLKDDTVRAIGTFIGKHLTDY